MKQNKSDSSLNAPQKPILPLNLAQPLQKV